MAFNNAYLARVDVGLNNSFTVDYSNGAGTPGGALGLFQYNGLTVGDSLATITAANYFVAAVSDFQVGTIIFITATDASGMYVVNAVTQADGSGLGAAITIIAYTGSLAVNGTITSAAFKAMYATPILLAPAPGAHKAWLVDSFVLETIYGTAQYTTGGAIAVQYDSTANGAGAPATATLAAATVNGYVANAIVGLNGSLASAASSAVVNKGLYLSNATAAFAVGDSTFAYHLVYSQISTTV
jgi:hypothetical protein